MTSSSSYPFELFMQEPSSPYRLLLLTLCMSVTVFPLYLQYVVRSCKMCTMPLLGSCLIQVFSTGSLCNKVEKRLQQCLPDLAKSIGKLVISSDSPDLQTHACQLMSCELDSLQQELELRLQASVRC